MRRQALLGVLGLWAALGSTTPLQAQTLEEGDWVGRVFHLTGTYMDVVYKVATANGAATIAMEVPQAGTFAFEDVRLAPGSISFSWRPSARLDCTLRLLDTGVYQGACIDPWGGFGGIIMAPPGSDVDAIELDSETIESIAGWMPPEEREDPPPMSEDYPVGRSVDVGGFRLNVFDVGTGDVTVVLEAGLGDNLSTWEAVQREVAHFTRVVAYDRAGLGYSEPSPGSRTPEQIATELHALLRRAEIEHTYVLVGHAEGGLYVRRFASLYPAEVAGMVLVDASHEQQGARWRALDSKAWDAHLAKQKAFYAMLPDPLPAEYEAFVRVLEDGEIPGVGRLPDVPTVVLTAARPVASPRWVGETPGGQTVWKDLHRALAAQSEHATHRVVETSGPYIHREEPGLVVDAIRQVVEAVRGMPGSR